MSGEFRNRFRDPGAKPQWAELTRWAGDHASILFQDLRRRMSVIDGLQEALHFAGPEIGWVPRYRVGDVVLLDVHVSPGVLEATAYVGERAPRRLRLTNASSVRSFAKLIRKNTRSE